MPQPYDLSVAQRNDADLIRHLTVKEESDHVPTGPVLQIDGLSFETLQLRAAIKEVVLHDTFDNLITWAGKPVELLASLVFIDTPGLGTTGNIKDEVLCHILGKKSQQILVELVRHDEVDLIIHLVLAGEQTAFSSLWRAVTEQCSADELVDLGERLVLAINGMNIFFTNPDFQRRWKDTEVAQRDGDHFSITLKDNILKKMSERGEIRPARIVFLDSKRFVEANRHQSYVEAYAAWRPIMEPWTSAGNVGYNTLQQLGLVDSFKENIDALCDPLDRGQGFLLRQVLSLIEQQGPKLFLRKNLKRTKLHSSIKKLRAMLLRCYDVRGKLNMHAVQEAVRKCMHFLDVNDLIGSKSIEVFASRYLNPIIEEVVSPAIASGDPNKWVATSFEEFCKRVFQVLQAKASAGPEHLRLFKDYCKERMNIWRRQWGYRTADLPFPSEQLPYTADLVKHALRFHAREMLYQLLAGQSTNSAPSIMQDAQDEEQMRLILAELEQLELLAEMACQQYGVTPE